MSEMRINSGGSRERRLTDELAAKDAEIARLRADLKTVEAMRDRLAELENIEDERDELLGEASAFDARLAFANRHAKEAEDLLRQATIELGMWRETWTDESGTTWQRPTAWAYAQACRVRDEAAEAMRAKCFDVVAIEMEAWREAGHTDDGDLYAQAIAALGVLKPISERIAALAGSPAPDNDATLPTANDVKGILGPPAPEAAEESG